MIDEIGDAIVARLDGLGLFRLVEKTISAKALQVPPAVVVFLAYDRKVVDKPTVTRELGWDLLLLVPALGVGRGQKKMSSYIDNVRDAFVDWLPWDSGGVLPADVPEIRLEGIENTLLVYTIRVTMRVMPQIIKKQS